MRPNAHLLLIAGVMTAVPVAVQEEVRFSVTSELVVLQVIVTDRAGRLVTGLPAEAFRVLDDGEPVTIRFFSRQDAPATAGVLVDVSGSMRETSDRLRAGITAFADASHPDDEFLPLVFNERTWSPLAPAPPFTRDAVTLRRTLLASFGARGRTAFHDAVASALARLESGRYGRRVLIVLSDGGDNASRLTLDRAVDRVLASNVVIYTIAIEDALALDRNPRALRRLADASGGLSFRPGDTRALDRAFQAISDDIRGGYTLAFVPGEAATPGRFRPVRVTVATPDHRSLRVRTRAGYVSRTAALNPGARTR